MTQTAHHQSSVDSRSAADFRNAVLEVLAQYLDTNYASEVASRNPGSPFKPGRVLDPIPSDAARVVSRVLNNTNCKRALEDILDPSKTREILSRMNTDVQREKDSDLWAVYLSCMEVTLVSYMRAQKVESIAKDPVLATIEKYATTEGHNKFRKGLGSLIARIRPYATSIE